MVESNLLSSPILEQNYGFFLCEYSIESYENIRTHALDSNKKKYNSTAMHSVNVERPIAYAIVTIYTN